MEKSIVGKPINFRGLVYSPINEQGVVYLFGLVAEDLNIRVESVQQGYPDCTGIRYLGTGKWERVRIEFEYRCSNFDHEPEGCDIIVCWEDDLSESEKKKLKGVEIIELKTMINTPEIPNRELKDPDKVISPEGEFDLHYHYERKNVAKNIRDLYEKLDKKLKGIHVDIWRKFSKTAITYYSPEKMFVYLGFQKRGIRLEIFTNEENIEGVENIRNHTNWGRILLKSDKDFDKVISAIKRSYEIMKKAVKENINTGWFAKTPKDIVESGEFTEKEED